MALVHRRGWDPRAFDESDWCAAWADALAPFRAHANFPSPDELSAAYAARTAGLDLPPLRFVAAPPKKPKRRGRGPVVLAELYEGSIVERGAVPTRLDDWHDFFNALAFVAFPRAKLALHTRQYRALAARLEPLARRLPGARSREQDALALFDEGGIAVAIEPELARGLPGEPDAFERGLRELTAAGNARAVPFGHALFEHLIEGLPCPLGTAHVVSIPHRQLADRQLIDALDLALSRALSDPCAFVEPSPARGLSLVELALARHAAPH